MGDPEGVGPEITVKCWEALRNSPEHAFAVIAPKDVFSDAEPITDLTEISDMFSSRLPLIDIESFGRERSTTDSIQTAVSFCLSHQASAMVTNPISKDVLYKLGFKYPGHTEYLGKLTEGSSYEGQRGPAMLLSGGGLRVALVTIHMSLKDTASAITAKKIKVKARILHESLKRDFGIKEPRIAMAGLNPHAGENGALGLEEIEIINPAAQELRAEGIKISNARSADTLFHAEARQTYDAVLAMYHDQGLIPVKTLDFHGGVNITLGLPIIRTSPDHGTAFDIAGKGIARPDSLIAAIKTARILANNRYG